MESGEIQVNSKSTAEINESQEVSKGIKLLYPSEIDNAYSGKDASECTKISDCKAYKINLQEGLSAPFEAKVSLLVTKKIKSDYLNHLLGKPISIELRRETNLKGMHIGTRKLTGVIVSFVFDGIVATQSSNDASGITTHTDCYSYTLTIVSRMHLLSLNKRTKMYVNESNGILSFVDVVNEIFMNYEGRLFADTQKLVKTHALLNTKAIIYQQVNESDLDFINRLCLVYGINYNTYYDAENYKEKVVFSCDSDTDISGVGKESKETSPVLDFNNGLMTSVNCQVDYKNNLEPKGQFLLHRAFYEENIIQNILNEGIDDIASSKLGIEIIKNIYFSSRTLTKTISELNVEGKKTVDEIEADIIKSSYEGLVTNNSNRFIAQSSDFVFVPGVKITIPKYIDETKDEFLITRTELKFRLKIDGEYIDSNIKNEDSEIEKNLVGIKCKSDTKLGSFCSFPMLNELSGASFSETDPFDIISRKYISQSKSVTNHVTASNHCQYYIGTVCASNGEITTKNGQVKSFNKYDLTRNSLFYVLLSNQSKPVVAQYVASCVSELSSGLNCPKIGQKVLVIFVDGMFLIHGIIPQDDGMESGYAGYDDELEQSDLTVYDTSYVTMNDSNIQIKDRTAANKYVNNNMLGRAKFSKLSSFIKFLIMQNLIDAFVKHVSLELNSKELLEKYNEKDASGESLSEKIASNVKNIINLNTEVEEARISNKTETYTQKKSELDKSHSELDACALGIIKLITDLKSGDSEDSKKGKKYLAELVNGGSPEWIGEDEDAEGEIALSAILSQDNNSILMNSANGSVNIHAKKTINISSDDQIIIRAAKGIHVIDDSQITLAVGKSEQTIDNDEISLKHKMFGRSLFGFDSSLNLSSLGGASLKGITVDMKARSKASMSDAYGGKILTECGDITQQGYGVTMATIGKGKIVKNFVKLSSDIAKILTDELSSNKDVQYWVPESISSALSFYEHYEKIKKIYEFSKNKPNEKYKFWIDLITEIISIGNDLFELVVGYIEKTSEDKTKDIFNYIRIAVYSTNQVLAILALAPTLKEVLLQGHASSISLSPGQVLLEYKEKKELGGKKHEVDLCPLAGVDMNQLQQNGQAGQGNAGPANGSQANGGQASGGQANGGPANGSPANAGQVNAGQGQLNVQNP